MRKVEHNITNIQIETFKSKMEWNKMKMEQKK